MGSKYRKINDNQFLAFHQSLGFSSSRRFYKHRVVVTPCSGNITASMCTVITLRDSHLDLFSAINSLSNKVMKTLAPGERSRQHLCKKFNLSFWNYLIVVVILFKVTLWKNFTWYPKALVHIGGVAEKTN